MQNMTTDKFSLMALPSILIVSLLPIPSLSSSPTGLSWATSLSNAMLASSSASTSKRRKLDQELTDSVTVGAELAMAECGKQFKDDVWNCPTTAFRTNQERLENNRETAFMNAILSAGVAHTVSRNCSAGGLTVCGCETNNGLEKTEVEWKWGGCSDNLVFGEAISKRFLDTDSQTDKPKSLAILHNNKAGRIAVRKTMRTLCKCHGVSGSCALQSCWRQIGDLRKVGRYLKKQYKGAMKVDYSNGILQQQNGNLLPSHRNSKPLISSLKTNVLARGQRSLGAVNADKIKKRKLVFLKPSPDYCRMNHRLGHRGVRGRQCELDPEDPTHLMQESKCTAICTSCGLVVKREVVEVERSCNCRFEWCCNIKCEVCTSKRIRLTCVPPAHHDQITNNHS